MNTTTVISKDNLNLRVEQLIVDLERIAVERDPMQLKEGDWLTKPATIRAHLHEFQLLHKKFVDELESLERFVDELDSALY